MGLIWDSRLTFSAHIKDLKSRCLNALNIIKVLSHSNWGSDTKTLIKLFRSLVRSKLDYGCFVYGSRLKSDLETLNIVHRRGIRLCLKAFKSSPNESLYVQANEPPLELRREELAMRYALKIAANHNNPVYESIFNEDTPHNSLGDSIRNLFREADIDRDKILPSRVPDIPVWQSEPNEVSFKLSVYDKSTTNPEFFKSKFLSDILPDYKDYFHVYTDGSKKDRKAAFGVYCEYGSKSNRISNDSSIFTAEIEAIKSTLQYIEIRLSHRQNKNV